MRSQAYSNPSVFSFLMVLLMALASCHHVIADYSFMNELDEDVELYLYISDEYYSLKIAPYHLILKGDNVQLLSVETDERDGFGYDYFNQLVDSAKVRVQGQEQYIAIWRQGGEYELSEGWENLKDFYVDWMIIHQHAGSHAEFAYKLELEEE